MNLKQTAEERRQKYHLVKCLGLGWPWASQMRDWPLAKIERYFDLEGLRDSFKKDPLGPYAQFMMPGFNPHPHGFFAATQSLDNYLIDGRWESGSDLADTSY